MMSKPYQLQPDKSTNEYVDSPPLSEWLMARAQERRNRARQRRRDEEARYLEIIRRRAEARRYRGVRP